MSARMGDHRAYSFASLRWVDLTLSWSVNVLLSAWRAAIQRGVPDRAARTAEGDLPGRQKGQLAGVAHHLCHATVPDACKASGTASYSRSERGDLSRDVGSGACNVSACRHYEPNCEAAANQVQPAQPAPPWPARPAPDPSQWQQTPPARPRWVHPTASR